MQEAVSSGDQVAIRTAADALTAYTGTLKGNVEPLLHRLEGGDFTLDRPRDDSSGE